jgi:hypothetical protein
MAIPPTTTPRPVPTTIRKTTATPRKAAVVSEANMGCRLMRCLSNPHFIKKENFLERFALFESY